MRTVFWEDQQLKMIDQRILPGRFEVVAFSDHKSVSKAITNMTVRGAPAIGVAALSTPVVTLGLMSRFEVAERYCGLLAIDARS